MKAVILAAGYATRLYPLTLDKPKALLSIAGKPIIEHLIQKIPEEIKDICIITNSKFKRDFDEWLKNFSCGKNLRLIDDGSADNSNRLGSIGDMNLVINKIGADDMLVIASDNIFDFKLEEAFEFFRNNRKDLVVIYDIKSKDEARKFGVVELDKNKKIKEFLEKPEKPKTTLASTGIYFFTKDSILLLKDYLEEGNSREGPGYFVKWLARKKEVCGFMLKGRWHDIGTIEDYEKAKKGWENHKIKWK